MSSIGRIVLIASFFCFYFATVVLLSCTNTSGAFRDATFAIGHLDDNQEWLHGLTEATAEKMPYQLHQLIAIVLAYSLPTRADKEEFKGQISEGVARNNEEKDVAENIHREHEVRVRMTEYKTLIYVAHYLAFNGKMLKLYGLPYPNTYHDVSAEVDGPATESIVQQELNAYSPTDLEHVTELVGQLNRNQRTFSIKQTGQ
ncbi:LOW QUALITY PROTEIN: Helitron helicase [Phytophthora megakarya]|uniref:Helitron helicase n=1 Tax=Phytophthora megakarya TaxID=4795 RepID=A0A225UZG6_9STRA|nr:LOW QUALITY PROTEIN: Helitron helicase [Phytophthora megakarya]